MFSLENIQEIIDSLRHNKLRTVLTGLSVSWGIFILIVLLGAGNGLKNGVTSNFKQRATNTVQMSASTTSMPYQGLKSGRNLSFTHKQEELVNEQMNEVTAETGIVEKNLLITYKQESGNYNVRGVNPDYLKVFNLTFEPGNGRFIHALDMKSSAKIIILDQKIEKVLFKEKSAIGEYVKVGNVMFRVVGVNSQKERWGNGNAYIPFSTAQTVFNPGLKFGSMAMVVKGLETQELNDQFNDKLRTTVARNMRFDPKDTQAVWLRNSQRDYLETMKIFAGITLFVSIIGIFTLIAGIVGVSNIMLVSVKERTREIGIRKAIGAPPSKILQSIILESILITAIFGYVGMMMGIGLTEIISLILDKSATGSPEGMTIFKNPTVDLSYVLISTGILILSGIIAGYMPARKAVRIKPVEAMRQE